jgi:hypothetical protein
MPYKDAGKKRAYQREYMRKRRGTQKPVLDPYPPKQMERLDPTRPYEEYLSPFPRPAYWKQDGALYDKQTLMFVGMAPG